MKGEMLFLEETGFLYCCPVAVCFAVCDTGLGFLLVIWHYKGLPLWSTCFCTRTDISTFFLTLSYCLLSQPFSLGSSAFPTFMLMNLYVASFLETPQPTSSVKSFVSPSNHSWWSVSTVALTGNATWYQLVKRAGRIELFGYCKCIFLRVFASPFSLWLLHLPITA